jgi:hypothetical protein
MNLFNFIEYAAKSVKDAYKSMQNASEEIFNNIDILKMEETHETSNNL